LVGLRGNARKESKEVHRFVLDTMMRLRYAAPS
jgi:hypothetical protein